MYQTFISSGWAPISYALIIFLFCFGFFALVSPQLILHLGRRYQEPGSTALLYMRLAGLLIFLIAIAMMCTIMFGAFLYHFEY